MSLDKETPEQWRKRMGIDPQFPAPIRTLAVDELKQLQGFPPVRIDPETRRLHDNPPDFAEFEGLSPATQERIRRASMRFGLNSLEVLLMSIIPRPEPAPRWRFQMVIRGGEHVGYRVYKPANLLGAYTFHSYQWF